MWKDIHALIVFLVVLDTIYGQQPLTKTICETTGPEVLTCPLGKSIYLVNILYGRTHALPQATCNPYQSPISNFNCVGGSQATNHINKLCQGKSTCRVENSYKVLGDPCASVPKFLKIDYQCIVPTLPPTTTIGTTTPSVMTSPVTTTIKTTKVTTKTTNNVVTVKTTTLPPSQNQTTICETKSATFACPAGKVLTITHVLWGRLPPAPASLCNPYNTPVVGAHCKGGPAATQHVEKLCNYKQTCVVANDWTKLGPDPCTGIPKYLQVSYQCDIPTTTATTPLTISTKATTPTTKTTTPTVTTPTTQTTPTTPTTIPTTITTLPPGVKSQLVCPPKKEVLRCPPGYEILINTVFYGRASQSPCNTNKQTFTNLNCKAGPKSNDTVHLYCDHQASCIVYATNAWLKVPDPCPRQPKYLKVTYHCHPLGAQTTTPTTSASSSTTSTTTTSTTPTTTSTTTTPTTTSTTTTPTTTSTTTTSTTTSTTTTPTTTSTTTTPTTTSTTTTPTTSSTTTTSTTTSTTTPTTTSTTTTPTTTSTTTTPTTTSTTTTPTTTTTTTTPVPTTTRMTTPMTTLPRFINFQPPTNVPQGSQICHEYLISGQHGVPDNQLTASSSWNSHLPNDNNGPERSRLFTQAYDYGNGTFYRGAWSAGVNDKNQYIQVEFMRPSLVRGIVTQGRHLNPLTLCCIQRVNEYKVSWSIDGIKWEFVKDKNGNDMLFKGNMDEDSLVTHMFDCPFIARYLRIHPQNWHNHISLRFDVIGCQAITTSSGQCDPGWKSLPNTNTCLLFSNKVLSWKDAKRECQLNHGHLVDIETIPKRDFILQEISKSSISMWWIGLNNQPRKDTRNHKWTDGKPLDTNVLQWKKGQPDNGGYGEHCGEFWNKELNDDNCDLKRNFICEKDMNWKPPVNKPSITINTPPTAAPTAPPTNPTTKVTARPVPTTTRKPPPTVNIPLPTQPGAVNTGNNLFATGCIGGSVGTCAGKPEGNYQSCKGCGHYITCAASGTWQMPCPANLKWDDNVKSCQFRSSTCKGP